ncbi:MAG: hypothetical protein L6V93_16205 [Clostridiales bacterium]|nr:MAG: hypothetical protein L6V93_16205 [Clostridiales bacterium]
MLNTLLISGTSALLKCAGLFFRVYLSNTIGAEGMGLYQLIFFALRFSHFAHKRRSEPCRHARCVRAERRGRIGRKTSGDVVRADVRFLHIFGGFNRNEPFCGGNLHAFFKRRAVHRKHKNTYVQPFVYRIFCGFFKGYFTAEGKAYHISNSQILEDFVKIFTVVFVFAKFGVRDITFACRVIMHSIVLAEMCSCLFLFLFYKRNVQNVKKTHKPHRFTAVSRHGFRSVAGRNYNVVFLHTAENVLIPSGLFKIRKFRKNALSLYGMLRGMAMPVLLFPVVGNRRVFNASRS